MDTHERAKSSGQCNRKYVLFPTTDTMCLNFIALHNTLRSSHHMCYHKSSGDYAAHPNACICTPQKPLRYQRRCIIRQNTRTNSTVPRRYHNPHKLNVPSAPYKQSDDFIPQHIIPKPSVKHATMYCRHRVTPPIEFFPGPPGHRDKGTMGNKIPDVSANQVPSTVQREAICIGSRIALPLPSDPQMKLAHPRRMQTNAVSAQSTDSHLRQDLHSVRALRPWYNN
jgi:hypothetical protein